MRAVLVMVLLGLLLPAAPAVAQEVEGPKEAIRQEVERGPVRVTLVVQPKEPVIGDVIELILEATGEAGVEVLMPEFGEALGRFEIVDFAPSTTLTPAGDSLSRQRYRLQPSRSGPQSIPPLRVEFVDRRNGQQPAPEGEDAYEILTERVRVDVRPILAADAPLDLEPAHPDLGPRRTGLLPIWGWAIVVLVGLVAIAPVAWRSYQTFTARRRQRSAYEVARGALDDLLAFFLGWECHVKSCTERLEFTGQFYGVANEYDLPRHFLVANTDVFYQTHVQRVFQERMEVE